ncbi:hypothetical protein [Streptomyces sp. HC307]|uniref:hypothetical protein n=1 Tax=Streptomyces flavusporus TaxID=3385496 RepID=UPI003917234F
MISRGGQLAVTVNDCPTGGTITSPAFPTTRLPVSAAGGALRAIAIINSNARPGRYDITVNCSGRVLTRPGAFTVLGGVRGGIGGSSSVGATPTDMAIGGGMVASAVLGGGLLWVRRRSEQQN